MSKARGLADLGNAFDDGALSNRNLIINGKHQIRQRGDSVVGVSTTSYNTSDRWQLEGGTTLQVDTSTSDGPSDEFPKALKVSRNTAVSSLTAGQYHMLVQKIEAQNLHHVKYGSADAKPLTMSFWVKSTATGTFNLNFYCNDSGTARILTKQYTINTANTWEHKVLTFEGDTDFANIANDNGVGMWCQWFIAAGSTFTSGTLQADWSNYVAANYAPSQTNTFASANGSWEITGVQLEVGDTATPFEHRSYGDELARCQRYYQKTHQGTAGSPSGTIFASSGVQNQTTTGMVNGVYVYPVQMRGSPTVSYYDFNGTASKVTRYNPNSANNHDETGSPTQIQPNCLLLNSSSGSAASQVAAHMELDAEL